MEKKIDKGFFKDNFIDFDETDIIKYKEDGVSVYNFSTSTYDTIFVWAGILSNTNQIMDWLDEFEGSFEVCLYYYEDGRLRINIEYPYDCDELEKDIFVTGEGAEEIRSMLKPYIDEAEANGGFDEFNL